MPGPPTKPKPESVVEKTAMLVTQGFRDVLEMGHQKRFAQYDLRARPPAPLIPRPLRFEAIERITARGEVDPPRASAFGKTADGLQLS